MRKMKSLKFKAKVNVVEHIILKNGWEYYITDRSDLPKHIVEAVVMGFETEMGDVYLPEIQPYIRSATNKLDDIMPCDGWEWDDQ